MIVTHRMEFYGESGLAARNKEWDSCVRQRKMLEKKKEPIPSRLKIQPYTDAHKIGNFYNMVYGLRWEEES